MLLILSFLLFLDLLIYSFWMSNTERKVKKKKYNAEKIQIVENTNK